MLGCTLPLRCSQSTHQVLNSRKTFFSSRFLCSSYNAHFPSDCVPSGCVCASVCVCVCESMRVCNIVYMHMNLQVYLLDHVYRGWKRVPGALLCSLHPRQCLSFNLALGWQPANPSDHSVSALHSVVITGTHGYIRVFAWV